MSLKEPTRALTSRLIDKAGSQLRNESDQFQAGQIVATTLFTGIYKVGVFLSYEQQRLPTDPIEYAHIGEVVTFSISGPSKSKQEFEKWRIKTTRLASDREIGDHKKVYPPSS